MAIQNLQQHPRFQGACCDNNTAPKQPSRPNPVSEQMLTTARDSYEKALKETGDKDYAKKQQIQALNGLLEKLNKQAVPNATPEELQAVLNAQKKSQEAGRAAYKKALAETGNQELAWKQHAETIFKVGASELQATPEGRSYLQKGNALHEKGKPMPDCCAPNAPGISAFA